MSVSCVHQNITHEEAGGLGGGGGGGGGSRVAIEVIIGCSLLC